MIIPYTSYKLVDKFNIYRYESRFVSNLYHIVVDYPLITGSLHFNKFYGITNHYTNQREMLIYELTKDWDFHKAKSMAVCCPKSSHSGPYPPFYIIPQKHIHAIMDTPLEYKYYYKKRWNFETNELYEIQKIETSEWLNQLEFEYFEFPLAAILHKIECRIEPDYL